MKVKEPEKPVAYDAWQEIAYRYSEKVKTKPHNAYYERPATLALLPDVNGMKVFDAGCGPGVLAEWLNERGAEVVGIDIRPNMIEESVKRLGATADIRIANLGGPLDFLDESEFDLVVCSLVLNYIKDWNPALTEFFRILKSGGGLVMSVHHPFSDYLYREKENYFEIDLIDIAWHGFGGEPVVFPTFRRSLQEVFTPITNAGFVIEEIVEPLPTEEFKEADPKNYEELMRLPGFLCLRAHKPA